MTLQARFHGNHAPTSTSLCVFNVPPSPGQRQAAGPAPATASRLAGRGEGRSPHGGGPAPLPSPRQRRGWAGPGEGCRGGGGGAEGCRAPSRGGYLPGCPPGPTDPCWTPPEGASGSRCRPLGSGVSEAWPVWRPQTVPQSSSGLHGWAGGVPDSLEGSQAALLLGRREAVGPERVSLPVPSALFQPLGPKPTAPTSVSSPGAGLLAAGCPQPPGRGRVCLGKAGGNPCLQESWAGGGGRLSRLADWGFVLEHREPFSPPVTAHTRAGCSWCPGRVAWSRGISCRRSASFTAR